MTPSLLSHLERLLAIATPAPWRTSENQLDAVRGERTVDYILGPIVTVDHGLGPEDDSERIITTDGGCYGPSLPDCDLIVAMRNSIEPLLRIAKTAEAWHRCSTDDAGLNGACRRHDRRLHEALTEALAALKETP